MNTKSKAGLVKDLMERGFSARKAREVVNAIFYVMTCALKRGEEVDTPLGMFIARGRDGKSRREIHKFRNVNTGEINHKAIRYRGARRVIKFKQNENLIFTPPPAPDPPLNFEELECRRLAAELTGVPMTGMTDRSMAAVKEAAEFPQPKPGRLLLRLQRLKAQGRSYPNAGWLADAIRDLYFL
jgi:nucleoid DNA-binding protein